MVPIPSRIALVTGSAKRVGREISLHLARAGWDIALHCHHSLKEAEALREEIVGLGRCAKIIQADLSDEGKLSQIIPQVVEFLGPVSLLVHNASLFEKEGLSDLSYAQFEAHMKVNCFAGFALLRDMLAALPQQMRGQAIMLSDGMHGWSISPSFFGYSLSKLALEEGVKMLAPSLASRLRVNVIAPGATLPGVMEKPGTYDKIRKITPTGEVSSPEEICQAIDFLLNAPSVTGQVIYLSGGLQRA